MLKLLRRKKVAKRIFYVLAAIIIPAFVIWGSASVINKNKLPDYAGILFGRKVSFDEFRDAMEGWRLSMKLQYGEKANEIIKSFFDPAQAAWDRLILLREAKIRRIQIKDNEVVAMITNLPFLERNGHFDPQTYDLFTKYSLGETPHAFEEKIRQNIAMAKVFDDVTRNIAITDDEVRKEYEKQNIQTRVKYVFFPAQGYKDKVNVTDAEIQDFYEKNKEAFRVAPQINALYCFVEFKEDTTDAQKQEASEKLKKLRAEAAKKGFEAAARDAGFDVKETGLFGLQDPIPTLGWMPQLSSLLFDQTADSLSKVVESNRGAYLFRIKEKKDAYLPDYSEVKEKAKNKLLEQRSKEFALKKARDFVDKLKTNSLSFEQAAQEDSLEVKETPLFTRDSYISELGMAPPLKEAAFKLAKDEALKDIIELEQGFFAIKSVETILVDEEKFKEEKDEFSKQVLEQKRDKAFNEFFAKLREQAGLISYIPEAMLK